MKRKFLELASRGRKRFGPVAFEEGIMEIRGNGKKYELCFFFMRTFGKFQETLAARA